MDDPEEFTDSELPMEGAVGIPSAEQWSCGISIWEKNLGKKFLAGRIPKEFPVAAPGFPGMSEVRAAWAGGVGLDGI